MADALHPLDREKDKLNTDHIPRKIIFQFLKRLSPRNITKSALTKTLRNKRAHYARGLH